MSDVGLTPLGRKIAAAILGTTLLALILGFLLNLGPTVYGFRQAAAERASAQAELLAASLAASVDFDDPAAAAESLATLSLVRDVAGAAVYVGTSATPFAAYGVSPARVDVSSLTVSSGFSDMVIASPVPAGAKGSVLVLAISLEEQWKILKDYLLVGTVLFPVIFFFSYRMAWRFRRKLGDPLAELTSVVREISGKKDYSRRVDYEGDDEIGVLVSEFNAMLRRVELRDDQLNRHKEILEATVDERTLELRRNQLELLRNNRLLLSEIKKRAKAEMIREEVERINRHDLKSGLSLVIGYPEILLNEGGLTPGQQKNIRRIRAAGYRMLDMISNQLDIFKMEKGIYTLSTSRVDLIEIVCGLEEEFAPLLEKGGVELGIDLDGREVVGDEFFPVTGEAALLRTMLRNLMQNAIEASRPGDLVTVSFESVGDGRVHVTNPVAVPAEIRRRFFDKYVTRGKENGTGLGTYFAALVAKTHGADIALRTGDDMGTLISIRFKKTVPADVSEAVEDGAS
ncbi:HAMP domain-containing protein [Pseudodesulfovibrio cashew]|uniref:histidine kinase n=1 Tax=Pseudodesulfovibrio cashew TaxID=2678688 RepID=A0A6I6JBU8_9BACT|nr:ATP-binding protein [Pseudodesulfovibrio cashew]QGY39561.1 HAMP domain-containing protein [Pseudodesulfovibrio cashew]